MLKLNKQELLAERWGLIPGETKKYVSNMGRVKWVHKNGEKFIKPYFRKRVPPYYIKVRGKEFKLAVVVWSVFKGDYNSKKYSICHKGLKTDDRLLNLVLLSKQEQGRIHGGRAKRRGIYKVDKANKIVYEYYSSTREAGKRNYCSRQTILDSINGKYKNNVTGFDFVWANKVDNEIIIKGRKPWRFKEEE